jgi:hypothetical protein
MSTYTRISEMYSNFIFIYIKNIEAEKWKTKKGKQ